MDNDTNSRGTANGAGILSQKEARPIRPLKEQRLASEALPVRKGAPPCRFGPLSPWAEAKYMDKTGTAMMVTAESKIHPDRFRSWQRCTAVDRASQTKAAT